MSRCIRKHIRLFLDIPKKNVLHGQPESSIFNKKLRKNKNPCSNYKLNRIVFLSLPHLPMAHARIPLSQMIASFISGREGAWETIFHLGRFSFFLYPSFNFWKWGERIYIYGLWLGLSPRWALCREILLSRTSCFQKVFRRGLSASRRFSEEAVLGRGGALDALNLGGWCYWNLNLESAFM